MNHATKRTKTTLAVGAVMTGVLLVGGCAKAEPVPATTVTMTPAAITETVQGPVETQTETVTETVKVVSTQIVKVTVEPPGPAVAIEEGTWTVGVDVKAGTYRTIDSVGDRCYWSITRSGSNGDDIIANDIPGGGRPTVTLRKGQDFTSHRCGDWKRV